MTKQKLTYNDAIVELESILAELESNAESNMDLIADKVKRASILIQFCKNQLHELDEDLEKIMNQLDD